MQRCMPVAFILCPRNFPAQPRSQLPALPSQSEVQSGAGYPQLLQALCTGQAYSPAAPPCPSHFPC